MKVLGIWRILITSFLPGPIINGFRSASLSSVLFQISKDLRLTGFESGIISSTQPAAGIIFGTATGIITDRLGIKKLFRLGIFILSLGIFLTAFSADFYTLLAIVFFTSFGMTLYLPPLLKLLPSIFADKQRGLAIGILGGSLRVAAALAFLIAPFILAVLGSWRWIFLIFGGVSLILVWFVHRNLRTINLLEPPIVAAKNSSAAADLKQILKSRNIQVMAVAKIFLTGSSQSLSAFLPFLLQMTGSSFVTASLVATTFWMFQAAGTLAIPRFSDVINRRVFIIRAFCPVASLLALTMAYSWENIVLTFIVSAVLGFIFAGVTEVTFLIILADSQIGAHRAGGAVGLLNSIGAVGGILSTLAIGALIDISGRDLWPILTFIAALQLILAMTSFFMKEKRIS